jgi:integrase
MVANIDLERHRVHVVNRAATVELPPFTVKAERQSVESKERSVPIPEAALPDLTEAMTGAFRAGGFLALTPTRFRVIQERWQLCREGKAWGGHKWRPWQNRDMINNVLRDAKFYFRKAGVELTAPFTLATFRKSFAQNHAGAGTPPRTLAKLLGHSSTRVTMQFYNRVTDANERAAGEAMDRLLSRRKKGKDVG